jgi:elongation factor 1 alpha-like protein
MGNLAKGGKKATATPTTKSGPAANVDQRQLDLSGLNLLDKEASKVEEAPKMTFAQDKLLEEVRKTIEAQEKPGLSLVVIGMYCPIISLPD